MLIHHCTCRVLSSLPFDLFTGYSTASQAPPPGALQVDFESVFGAKATGVNNIDSDGEVLNILLFDAHGVSHPTNLSVLLRHPETHHGWLQSGPVLHQSAVRQTGWR